MYPNQRELECLGCCPAKMRPPPAIASMMSLRIDSVDVAAGEDDLRRSTVMPDTVYVYGADLLSGDMVAVRPTELITAEVMRSFGAISPAKRQLRMISLAIRLQKPGL